MKKAKGNFTPAVNKSVLVILAGLLWLSTGFLLISFGYRWLVVSSSRYVILYALAGIFAGIIIHYFGFLRLVKKNLARIKNIEGKYCAFGFMSWKSYLIIIVMMSMGIMLRHSAIPREYLSVLYLGIGLALALSSVKYFRSILI